MTNRPAWAQWLKSNHHVGGLLSSVVIKDNTRPSTNKYGARAVRVDGILFDSSREAARYYELKILLAAGEITDLEIHPGFPLIVARLHADPPVFTTVGMFHADFRYRRRSSGNVVVEDVKSGPTKTEAYKLRKRIVEEVHGVVITEIA
jgi:hypothetical protein